MIGIAKYYSLYYLVPVSTQGYELVTDIVDGRPLVYYPE